MIPGIATERMDPWLIAQGLVGGPLAWQRIGTGRSNLTYLVTGTDRQVVVRRPPLGEFAPTAHDVLREGRFLGALHGRAPVPELLASCTDPDVTGAPFIVMDYLRGAIVATPAQASALSSAQRAAAGPALIDALVRLHRIDPQVVDLPHLIDRRDFVARQLKRWLGNWRRIATRDLPALVRAHDLLAAAIPVQARIGVVHGDFRLDNCVLDPDVVGILDWELATVGDPLADLGQLLAYWAEPGDVVTALETPPTVVPGFATRDELVERYLAAMGDAPIDYYLAFNWWKIACILEDVYTRVARGAMGEVDRTPQSFAEQAERVAGRALELAAALPAQ